MRIAVVGLGGVGGYIAANLAKTSHEVVGFARGEHLQKIQESGLKIIEDENSWSAALEARTLDEADGHFDIVLFCIKSYDLKESYQAVSSHVNAQTIVLSFANGVSHGDELRELSTCTVLDACVYILSHIEEAGVIRKKGKVFAAVLGGNDRAGAVVKDVFDEAGLRAKISGDIKTDIWKKYIFISAFATLTSYYDKSIGYVYEHHYDEVKALLNEIANVADAEGIEIFDEVQKALDIAKGLPYDSSTSMHLDFVNKKRNELETLSGFVINEAKIRDIKIPYMEKMYNQLKELS